jgi:2'-5' RNA ligase
MMRLFFGLEAPAELAMQIAEWRDRELGAAGRPVPPANFHITLAFVGELPAQDMEALALRVDEWVERKRPQGGSLDLNLTGYWQKPGIYWLGSNEWPEGLTRLASKLKNLSTAAGARRDRKPFQPHVTLFRNCRLPPPAPSSAPRFAFRYDHVTLFESRQGRRGMSYHPVATWDLLSGI